LVRVYTSQNLCCEVVYSEKEERREKREQKKATMDEILNKVGSYWFSRKASKEFDSVGDDINVHTTVLNTLLIFCYIHS